MFGSTPEAERVGRRLLLCVFGAWLTGSGAETLVSGDWRGVIFLLPGVGLTVALAWFLNRDARRTPARRWGRDDNGIIVVVLMGAVALLVRALLSEETPAERAGDLALSPVWVLLAGYYALARRRVLAVAAPG